MDRSLKAAILALAIVVAGCVAVGARAQNVCCSHCGSTSGVQTTCRPVLTSRPVEMDRWDAIEEEIALPQAHGLLACNCGTAGGDCCTSGNCRLCLAGGCRACCKVRPRNRLMRKTFLEEVPVVVWVVEYQCAACAARGGPGGGPPPTQVVPFRGASATVSDAGRGLESQSPGPAPSPRPHRPDAAPLDELIKKLHAIVPGS